MNSYAKFQIWGRVQFILVLALGVQFSEGVLAQEGVAQQNQTFTNSQLGSSTPSAQNLGSKNVSDSQTQTMKLSDQVNPVVDAKAVSDAAPAAGHVNEDMIEKQKGKFGITAFFIGGVSHQQLNDSSKPAAFEVFDSYISFNYKFSKDIKLSARPAFGYSTAGYNRYGDQVVDKARNRDFSFAAGVYNIFEDQLPSEVEASFKPRLYLPTSDGSKDQGMIARLRTEVEAYYYTGKYSNFRVSVKPSYYFQRETTYLDNSNPNRPNSLKTTSMADLEHVYEYNHNINKYFSVKPAIQFNDDWSNSSAANNKDQFHRSQFMYGVGFEVRPLRSMNYTFIVQTARDLIVADKSEETSFVLLGNITLL